VNLTLNQINRLERESAIEALMKCCGSYRWVEQMADARPFEDLEALIGRAGSIWQDLSPVDWLAAFSHHPKIGKKKAEQSQTEQERKWSEQEQFAVAATTEELLKELERLNSIYEEQFGYIFIVCATGKSTQEMIDLLRDRTKNDPETELRIAAGEQQKITELRLRKLFDVSQ
jgi:2-oxo-4-hydroxy-4-carboxy-5-ureidoimidazoline decarboxylase